MATQVRLMSTYTDGDSIRVTLYVSDCPRCGVVFGIPKEMERRRRDDGERFFCPNGHPMSWNETETDRLKEELTRAKNDVNWYRQAEQDVRKELTATKGQLTKARKRAGAGVCVECNRTFANAEQVQRHMETKHR